MTAAFAPSLGRLAAVAAQRPLRELSQDPAELARITLDLARRTGASHVLFPFDDALLAEVAGAELTWDAYVPTVAAGQHLDLADLDPEDIAATPRAAASIEAARFIAGAHPLAVHVPSPGRLVEQVGAPQDDAEQLACAEDVCAAYARALLEAGGRLLVVVLAAGEAPDAAPGLRRVGELFEVPCAFDASGGGDVVRLTAVELAAPPDALRRADGARVVLTDAPLEPGIEIGAVARLASTLSGGTSC